MRIKVRGISLFVLAIYFVGYFLGCSSEVIRRDPSGNAEAVKTPMESVSPVKKKMIVLDFFNESPYGGDDLGVVATTELVTELSRSSEFILESGNAYSFANSKEIYDGGGFKLVQLAKKAQSLGINLILYGRIIDARIRDKADEIGLIRETKSYTESKIEIKIFDVVNNKEFFSNVTEGYANDSSYRFYLSDPEDKLAYRQELLRYGVRVGMRKVIPNIIDTSSRLIWTGRVAKIMGEKVYINAGKASGVQIGDILKVFTDGEEIYDPETGALIGQTKGEVKGTVEVVDYFGPDGSIGIVHSGGAVNEGDMVRLY